MIEGARAPWRDVVSASVNGIQCELRLACGHITQNRMTTARYRDEHGGVVRVPPKRARCSACAANGGT